MDEQSEITGTERKGLRALGGEGGDGEATRCQTGKVCGLRAEQKKAPPKKTEGISFKCFCPTCQTSLMDVLTVIRKKKSWSC